MRKYGMVAIIVLALVSCKGPVERHIEDSDSQHKHIEHLIEAKCG